MPTTFKFVPVADYSASGYSACDLSKSSWASEASPTLGCSIEISRDIYMYIYICIYVGMSRMSN